MGAGSEYAKKPAAAGGSKLKFKPKLVRKQRVVDDDEYSDE